MTPVFLDANVPIYAAGQPHPLKAPCADVIRVITDRRGFVTSAEVLQEMLHVYRRRGLDEGLPVMRAFASLMAGSVEAIHARDVLLAADLGERYARLSARDLLHLAVMQRLGVTRIVTADRAFDTVEEVERLDPLDLDAWRETIEA